ncbi:protein N-terminal asparagine amidohydrolase isoform X1 [Anguilla anguilla]|uniref:protein N-terminal asparagine amidohydrolase isoform X1 n=1 Tax=Anguilla anguilla TaxID=7936 RepID=UPI0015B0702D|nr:protein N-terminal asparagine amidohydrolase isoform X1 [Anguilla anguilla]
MPLLIENHKIERTSTTAEFFAKYPLLQENAEAFRAKALVNVDPKCLLYVQQREFAATTPADNSVSVIGSDDATTCHLVLVRHTGSGAACLAHCDGSSTWSEVPLIVKAVTTLSSQTKEGRLELHLVGGFDDESNTSHSLSLSLLAAFQKQKEDIHLVTCCITGALPFFLFSFECIYFLKACNLKGCSSALTELNDILTEGIHRPVVYGIGVNVKTGEVFPASFPCRGPAEELRSARTFTGGQMADIYDSSKQQVKIGPCKWSPNRDIKFWLTQDDDTILKYLSTSPLAEPPHFVPHIKTTIQFLLDHPNPDSLFPKGQPQQFRRTEQGDWERVA